MSLFISFVKKKVNIYGKKHNIWYFKWKADHI
jgi:hypothetical protein